MTAPASYPLLWGSDATHPDTRAVCDGAMTQGVAAQGVVPNASLKTDQLNEQLRLLSLWAVFAASEASVIREFGDASDGNATITGGTTTLSRDMYYDALTIEPSGVLAAGGYRVFARTLVNTGVLSHDGEPGLQTNDDPNQGGAGAAQGGSLGGGDGGADGNANAAGTSTAASTAVSAGGAGGTGGTAGGNAGGTGGAVGTSASHGGWRHGVAVFPDGTPLRGGTGGGSGGSNTVSYGGGGGGGAGGAVWVSAQTLNNTGGIIRASGGAGGAGDTDVAGGSGGGGGVVFLFYRHLLGLGTVLAAGGAGGAAGAGVAGGAGADGTVLQIVI